MTSVVPMTTVRCRQPSAAMAENDVPSPKAAMATRSPQFAVSTSKGLTSRYVGVTVANEEAALLTKQRAMKASAKTGIGGATELVTTAARAKCQPIATTTGNSRKTRKSL